MADSDRGTEWEPPTVQTAGGWHPDPLGRYEARYHNGAEWTADVSQEGQRYVDPLGVASGPPANPPRNRMATAAMMLGVLAVATGWIPFLFAPAAISALLALVFGAIGLQRSRVRGAGRSPAIVGLTTGAIGVVATIVGALLTLALLDILDDYQHPNPHAVTLDVCDASGGSVTASGAITNRGTTEADYVIRIDFVRPGTDNAHRRTNVEVTDVPAGGTSHFSTTRDVALDDVACVVSRVSGPLPFGLDLEA